MPLGQDVNLLTIILFYYLDACIDLLDRFFEKMVICSKNGNVKKYQKKTLNVKQILAIRKVHPYKRCEVYMYTPTKRY